MELYKETLLPVAQFAMTALATDHLVSLSSFYQESSFMSTGNDTAATNSINLYIDSGGQLATKLGTQFE